MSVQAKVVAIEDGLLRVETGAEGCQGCTSCAKGRGEMNFLAVSEKIYPIGTIVDVDMPAHELNLISLLVYGFPLLLMLLGILFGSFVLKQELLGFVIGLTLTTAYYLILRQKQKQLNKDNRFTARVLGPSREGLVTLETCHKQH